MREIRFRAWDGNKMWYFSKNDTDGRHLAFGGETWGVWQYGNLIFDDSDKKNKLMQFTGLKDKNKKDIYEGDIVEYKDDSIWQVRFEMGKFSLFTDIENLSLAVEDKRNKIETEDEEIIRKLSIWWTTCKVIGNIYENPELLKKKMGDELTTDNGN